MKATYTFESKVWKHHGPAAWYFVSLPKLHSEEIRGLFQKWEEGWGRLKCQAKIGNTIWETAIWYDTHHHAYVLPLKAEIRRKEHIETDQVIAITIMI